jgi:Rieske Fe-S protein
MATKMNRREFMILATMAVAGCSSTPPGTVPVALKTRLINAGPVSHYTADGLYSRFWASGVYIIRRGNKLYALSSVCTHRRCLLRAQPDHSFSCPCHGSTFNPDGHVTGGPAKRDLPALETVIDENGDLLVTVPAA